MSAFAEGLTADWTPKFPSRKLMPRNKKECIAKWIYKLLATYEDEGGRGEPARKKRRVFDDLYATDRPDCTTPAFALVHAVVKGLAQ